MCIRDSIANGGATSNVGAVNFAGTAGVGNDRGSVNAVSAHDVLTYSALRQADPFPFADIALVADAKYGPAGCKAGYFSGDVHVENGNLVIEPATEAAHAVRLSDITDKQAIYEINLTDGVSRAIPTALDLTKCVYQSLHNESEVDVSVVLDASESEIIVTASGANLSGYRLVVQELSCAVTVIPDA